MRKYVFGAVCALIAFNGQLSASAQDVISHKSSHMAPVDFTRQAFKTLFTLPRTNEATKATRELLHDYKAWQKFTTRNFTAPNVGFLSIEDMKTTYTFTEDEQTVEVLENGQVRVSFEAVQEIRIFDRIAATNCVVGSMYLVMPKGVDNADGATVADTSMVMTRVDKGPFGMFGPCSLGPE